LKQEQFTAQIDALRSPPARGRGLKLVCIPRCMARQLSPPARGRGLKRLFSLSSLCTTCVAPRAGAWIETCEHHRGCKGDLSPPARGRGLKPVLLALIRR